MYFIPSPQRVTGCFDGTIVWMVPRILSEPLLSCHSLTGDESRWDRAAEGRVAFAAVPTLRAASNTCVSVLTS